MSQERLASWRVRLRDFSEAVPEIFFMMVGLGAVAVAHSLDVGAALENTVAIIAGLVLASEVLIRVSLHSHHKRMLAMSDRIDHLSERIDRLAMPPRDRAKLRSFARGFLDEKAGRLAETQRKLARGESCEVDLTGLFHELSLLVRCASETRAGIEAVASRQLEDYLNDGPAKEYFDGFLSPDFGAPVRRIFVLEKKHLAVPARRRAGADVRAGILDLIRTQNKVLTDRGSNGSDDAVRWLYRPCDRDDKQYLDHRVDPDFAPDWVLFDSELLVEHRIGGDSVAHMSVNVDTIRRRAHDFEELWRRGMTVDQLPGAPTVASNAQEVGDRGLVQSSRSHKR